jgi:hypothetical protein
MPKTFCIDCGALIDKGKRRCSEHERAFSREQAERLDGRWVYSDARWPEARRAAFVRDGWRCRVVEHELRCEVRGGDSSLEAHHHPWTVRELLSMGEDPFDPMHLVTVCQPHHRQIEQRLRQARERSRRKRWLSPAAGGRGESGRTPFTPPPLSRRTVAKVARILRCIPPASRTVALSERGSVLHHMVRQMLKEPFAWDTSTVRAVLWGCDDEWPWPKPPEAAA